MFLPLDSDKKKKHLNGCVRLTLSRNRNTYNDGKKSLIRGLQKYLTIVNSINLIYSFMTLLSTDDIYCGKLVYPMPSSLLIL